MKHIFQPAEGEALKLGPPAAGEVIIKVDSRQEGAPFAAGTETLLPGVEIPSNRHLDRSQVLFIHKGQGRVTLDGQSMTVVPGTTIFVPKQSWWSLRNTGTGLLQFAWVSEPGGVEEFFRELSRAETSAELAAVQEIAQRHGMELGTEAAAAPVPEPGRRHRRRRGRGRGGATGPSVARAARPGDDERRAGGAGAPPLPQIPGVPPLQAAAGVAPVQHAPGPLPPGLPAPSRQGGPAGGGRGRRHRGRRGGSGGSPAQPPSVGTAPATPKAGAGRGPRPQAKPEGRRGGRPRRFGRVKEVYMGGKWVRVTGEGPVISGDTASENKEELDA